MPRLAIATPVARVADPGGTVGSIVRRQSNMSKRERLARAGSCGQQCGHGA
jgi:hypothetical protein